MYPCVRARRFLVHPIRVLTDAGLSPCGTPLLGQIWGTLQNVRVQAFFSYRETSFSSILGVFHRGSEGSWDQK